MSIDKNKSSFHFSLLYLPLFLLAVVFFFLFAQHALSAIGYAQQQKSYFLEINSILSPYSNVSYTLTQLGDVLVLFSFLFILILYSPKFRANLLTATVISFLLAQIPKALFSVPRPAATINPDSFTIVGPILMGHNSFPSGHSITIFTTLMVLMFCFMPSKLKYKILWCVLLIGVGLIMASSRVGVGAHYPFDVVVGSILGYISAVLGILINQKYNLWNWMNNKRAFMIFIPIIIVGCVFLVIKIATVGLIIFYFALVTLLISLYIILQAYVKKQFPEKRFFVD